MEFNTIWDVRENSGYESVGSAVMDSIVVCLNYSIYRGRPDCIRLFSFRWIEAAI